MYHNHKAAPTMLSTKTFASLALVIIIGATVCSQPTLQSQPLWQRCVLIYTNEMRTDDSWNRHVARIDANGAYTDQQLFDAAIITNEEYHGKSLLYNMLNESEMIDLLNIFFSNAAKLDKSLDFLANGTATTMYVSFGVPWFSQEDEILVLEGQKYRMSIPSQRDAAAMWYIRKVKSIADQADWKHLKFYGTYYIKEDAVDSNDDVRYIQSINNDAQRMGVNTVWVPYYDAPNGFRGRELGFNVTVVQPRYAFLSSIDTADVKGDRLYSVGYKSANLEQSFEYEVRSQGESLPEYYIAHQYLAISQFTGASKYPQVFFVGGDAVNIFDKVQNERDAVGSTWQTYQDLANYLRGDIIPNWEIGIPFNPQMFSPTGTNTVEIQWTVPEGGWENYNSLRLDFSDSFPNSPNIWRGRVEVQVTPPSTNTPAITSFAQRIGTEKVNPNYNSVFVPLGNVPTPARSQLIIRVIREPSTPWPNVQRIVVGVKEPMAIANPIFDEFSFSSNGNDPDPTDRTRDSVPSHLQFGAGKLTDGQISPTNSFWWDGVVGWNWIEYPFSVTIDLGRVVPVSKLNVVSYEDLTGPGVILPHRVGAMVSTLCQPHMRGVSGLSCIPEASSGGMQIKDAGGTMKNITFEFAAGVRARYVTLAGVSIFITLLDEVEVVSDENAIVSVGAKYKISPITGPMAGGKAYGDNNQRLLDGNVFTDWVAGSGSDGILNSGTTGGTVEARWTSPRSATVGVIWMTNALPGYGIQFPDSIKMQWMNELLQWGNEVEVKPSTNCGPAPCARLLLPPGTQVTGIRGTFPPQSWYMVSEISVE